MKIEIFTTFTYPGNVLRIGFEQFGPIREGAMYERITKEISNTSLSDTGMLEQIFGRAAELHTKPSRYGLTKSFSNAVAHTAGICRIGLPRSGSCLVRTSPPHFPKL